MGDEISHIVQSAVDGYRVCIFAYGQTGSGKTHTMIGSLAGEQRGMMPRAAAHVFEYCDKLSDQGWTFGIQASMVEIYNEQIRDLAGSEDSKGETRHEIHHTRDGSGRWSTTVDGISSSEVRNADDVISILSQASALRTTSETRCNARSSRSHTIFTLNINANDGRTGRQRSGQLHL